MDKRSLSWYALKLAWYALMLAAEIALCSCQRSPRTESTPELIQDLQNRTNSAPRVAAARLLGERKAVQAVPELIASLKKEDTEPVRVSAARALGKIHDARAVDPLIKMLADRNPLLREASAHALGELRDRRAVGPLVTAMKSGNEEAGPALARIGEPAIEPLIDSLRNANGRRGGVDALAAIGQPAAGRLIEAFKSYTGDSHMAAAQALAEIDDPEVEQTLTSALREGDLRLASAAYKFLLRMGAANDDLLLQVLHQYGDLRMAEDFLRSERPRLKIAVQNWARENSYPMEVVRQSHAVPDRPRR
jgi:HEAT repeat protein